MGSTLCFGNTLEGGNISPKYVKASGILMGVFLRATLVLPHREPRQAL
jgi:hypothetical protein